jgi:hypothetical protein
MDAKSSSREFMVTDSLRLGLSTSGSLSHSGGELANLLETTFSLLHLSPNLVVGMQDRGVIPATEATPDLGQGEVR